MLRMRLLVLAAVVVVPPAAWPQGNPLGPEFRVNTYTANMQRLASAAAVPGGGFVVVWQSAYQDGSTYGVFGQRYDGSGVALGPEFRVNTYTTGLQRTPAAAADGVGNFIVVWSGFGQDGVGVLGQRYASTGAPLGAEFRINTTGGVTSGDSVAFDGAGNFVVVWARGGFGGGSVNVFGQRYAGSGAPLGTEFRVDSFTTSGVTPDVAVDGSGNFFVVWTSLGLMSAEVHAQRYASSGSPLGTEFRVSTSTGYQDEPAVASDPSGNFVIVWGDFAQDGSGFGVFGRRFAISGAPMGPEFRVNTYTSDDQRAPAVAADAAGNFVVVWESLTQDGSSFGVFGQRHASSGTPLGPEFRVNTFTTNSQVTPAVGADSLGNFVVVWNSLLQDGSGYGVFGQRYNQILPVELMRFGIE